VHAGDVQDPQDPRYRAQEATEREARRPHCKKCGTKFTHQRWTESEKKTPWVELTDSHLKLCGNCKAEAIEAEQIRKAAKKEADRQRREAKEAAHAAADAEAARKANRILGRFRC
jgi:hypothetical protein